VRARAIALALLATCGAALLVPIVYAPALQSPFLVPKFAALEVAAAIGFLAFVSQRASDSRPRWTKQAAVGAWLVLATSLASWAATGQTGAPYGLEAIARWGALFGVACGASVIADVDDARQRVIETTTIAAAFVGAVGLLQHWEILPIGLPVISTPGSTFGNRNFAAEFTAMALPIGVAAAAGAQRAGRRGIVVAIGVSLAIELLFLAATRARGAWLGAVCGLGTSLALARPRFRRPVLALVAGAVVLASAVAWLPGRYNPRDVGDAKRHAGVVDVLEESFDTRSTALKTRFGLWRRTVAMMGDHPVLGVGPGNWPVVFPRYAEPGAHRDGVLTANRAPRQAHDDFLEHVAETGFVGGLALAWLAAGVVIAARGKLRRTDRDARSVAAGASGALVALIAVAIAGFPLDMPGTLALAGIAMGLLVGAEQPLGSQSPSLGKSGARAYVPVAAALLLVAGAVIHAERNIRASRWLGAAERALRHDHGATGASEALVDLQKCLDASPRDYRAQLRQAQMLLREGRGADAANAARRALAIEPFAPNAWAALAAGELAQGDPSSAWRDASEGLELLADYPELLQTRARAADLLGDHTSAEADRMRISELAAGPSDDDTARAARSLTP
jgi:O-antigen ligase